MPLLDRALALLGLQTAPKPETETKVTVMREAAGTSVDPDDSEWRRLTGRSDKDLNPLTHERMMKLSQHLWESNPLANRLIELPLAYLLGKGVRLVVGDEENQKVLDRHWRDSINAWAIKLVKRGTLITYPGLPHGMASTHADVINADLLKFIKG